MPPLEPSPSDVLAVWTSRSFTANAIRVSEAMEGKPAVANHVIIITHQDKLGRWMGIQGEPGGVGLVDCTPFLRDSRTRSNHDQPRDLSRLPVFLASAAKTIGVRYDWVGIAEEGLDALHAVDLAAVLDHLWRWPADHGKLPGEVFCSNLAAMLYGLPAVGWAHPDLGTERMCMPADWWDWNDRQLWAA
jgi:hypothetical protein